MTSKFVYKAAARTAALGTRIISFVQLYIIKTGNGPQHFKSPRKNGLYHFFRAFISAYTWKFQKEKPGPELHLKYANDGSKCNQHQIKKFIKNQRFLRMGVLHNTRCRSSIAGAQFALSPQTMHNLQLIILISRKLI